MTDAKDNAISIAKEGRDPAKEMLIRNSIDVLRAFVECSDEVQRGILDMAQIIADPSVDADEKSAAEETLIEALYPKYHDEEFGIDSRLYEQMNRECEPEVEDELDNQEASFAEVLQRLMDERGMKQKDLAEKIGVGQPAVANMLNRRCRPQRRTIEKIAKALQVDPQTIWQSAKQ